MKNFLDMTYTPSVLALQQERGAAGIYDITEEGPARLSEEEVGLITSRDSIYMATVSEDGWPYVQHRGGDVGFISVLGPTTIGWIERSGNRQYLGTGNIRANGRVAMILVDYPTRTRLKILGDATYDGEPSAELLQQLHGTDIRNDGAITVEVRATTWNCPKYITPRFTAADVHTATAHMSNRLADLEEENRRLRAALT